MLNRLLRNLLVCWRKVFPSRNELVLREIEAYLKTYPFVKVHAAFQGESIKDKFYLVTQVDRERHCFRYFNPYDHANRMIGLDEFDSFSMPVDQFYSLLPDRHLNALIYSVHIDLSPYVPNQLRRRIGYNHEGIPIYIKRGLHVHRGSDETRAKWGDVALFEVASLSLDVGTEYGHGFAYYAGYGTIGLRIDIGEWELNPHYIDYEQQERDRLRVEYEAYKASTPFEEGDIIQAPGHNPQVFIRYEDADRTRMLVYPGKLIEGAGSIVHYRLVERKGAVVE